MPRLRESLSVVRRRDFRLLFAGQAVSVFGDRMVAIALAFAVLELDGSATEVGLVLACRTLPQVGSLPVGGVVADRATFGVSAALLARLRLSRPAARAPTSFLVDLRDGWDEFRSRTWVWSLVAAAALANLVWGAWNVLGPVVADRDLGGAATWGTLLAALGAGALAGAVLTIRSRPRRPLLVVVFSMLLFCPPLALLAAGAPPPLVAVGTFLAGVGMMFGNSVWESTLQRHIPSESLSRVSAYDWFGALAFQPLGLAIWGPVAALVGITAALWAAAAILAATALALLAVRDVRHLPPMPAPRPVASPAIGELST
jgi:hypothetical protein